MKESNDLIKVFHLIDHNGLGGAQVVLRELQEIDKCTMSFGSLTYFEGPSATFDSLNFTGFGKSLFGVYRNYFGLINWVHNSGQTVLHCHLLYSRIMGLLVKWRYPKITLIYHEHGEIWNPRFIYRLLNRICTPWVEAVISLNKPTSMKIGIKKVYELPNPVNGGIVKPWRIGPSTQLIIGYAGRIKRLKGWKRFVDIADYLGSENPEKYQFLMAGDGPEGGSLKEMLRKKRAYRLDWVGLVDDMEEFYNRIDVLIMPSHFEAGGLVHLEAQSRGIPVVLTDLPGPSSTLIQANSAYLIPNDCSTKEWANRISNLLTDVDELFKLRNNGVENARHYSVESYIEQLFKIYSSVTSTKASKAL